MVHLADENLSTFHEMTQKKGFYTGTGNQDQCRLIKKERRKVREWREKMTMQPSVIAFIGNFRDLNEWQRTFRNVPLREAWQAYLE